MHVMSFLIYWISLPYSRQHSPVSHAPLIFTKVTILIKLCSSLILVLKLTSKGGSLQEAGQEDVTGHGAVVIQTHPSVCPSVRPTPEQLDMGNHLHDFHHGARIVIYMCTSVMHTKRYYENWGLELQNFPNFRKGSLNLYKDTTELAYLLTTYLRTI